MISNCPVSCKPNANRTWNRLEIVKSEELGIYFDSLSAVLVYPIVKKNIKLQNTSQYKYSKSAGYAK
jgi:hypothetical protein